MADAKVVPYSLKDAPALIERLFPAQKISAEAQKERKAGAGQTLTALGSYWKGRKPLILVRACVLGALLPATNDAEADLAVFEKLLAIDDGAFRHRVKRKASWPAITDRPYLSRLGDCFRPEEVEQSVFDDIWPDVNRHLGTSARGFPELVEQLGSMRFGRTPKVADTFAGGGSVPFESARLGCQVYAADLNPVACMLTWGSLNILGASKARREAASASLRTLAAQTEKELEELGIEVDAQGNRAKAFLYCLEARCPKTGWMVPLLPSCVVSRSRGIVARLEPDPAGRRFNIRIEHVASTDKVEQANIGTVVDGSLTYELDGERYTTPIKTVRGDYTNPDNSTGNRLRPWERSDVAPQVDDIFQERLYCIQWIAKASLGAARPTTYFAAPTSADLAREQWIESYVADHLAGWQAEGLVPNMEIEPGDKTDEPIRTRGWRYWHHLFTPRQILVLATLLRHMTTEEQAIALTDMINYSSRLCRWETSNPRIAKDGSGKQVGGASDNPKDVFTNQALNTLYNFANRSFYFQRECFENDYRNLIAVASPGVVVPVPAAETTSEHDIYVTDPPYGDAVNYHEITEIFTSWLRGRPPQRFSGWTWDTRRRLAVQGVGEDFRAAMIDAYSAMSRHMPDNGLQIVMFTHQSSDVWGDMAQIFWGAGLQVMAAWYIATETTSELKKGGYVQGTVILVLRKRLSEEAGYKNEIVQEVKAEVAKQIDTMVGLNQSLRGHGRIENLFEDADLQMAGYAAALRVLTGYSKIDGRDMTREALRPRQRGEKGLVGEIIDFAVQVANEHMVPEGMDARVWERLAGAERFYLKMLDIETTGAKKLDNYQNFAKAFRVGDYSALMSTLKPNDAHLKSAVQLKRAEFGESEFGRSPTRAALFALYELQSEVDGDKVLSHLRDLVDTYDSRREDLATIAAYVARKREEVDPDEAKAARILHGLIRNERIGA